MLFKIKYLKNNNQRAIYAGLCILARAPLRSSGFASAMV
jgi:hypothetical protein